MPVRMVLRQTFEAKSIFLYLKAMRLEYARHKQGLLFICNKVHAPKQLAQRALAHAQLQIKAKTRGSRRVRTSCVDCAPRVRRLFPPRSHPFTLWQRWRTAAADDTEL